MCNVDSEMGAQGQNGIGTLSSSCQAGETGDHGGLAVKRGFRGEHDRSFAGHRDWFKGGYVTLLEPNRAQPWAFGGATREDTLSCTTEV